MGVLFELAQQTALLKLHIEALKCTVNGLIGLNGNVDQTLMASGETRL